MSESRSGHAAPIYTLVVETAPSGTAPREQQPPPARHEIASRETVIGRSPAATVRLDDLFVSIRHARLLLRDHDLHLEDLGSTNTTRRNGVVVRTRVRVNAGDVLEFGPVRCRVEGEGTAPGERAASSEAPAAASPPAETAPRRPASGAAPPSSPEPNGPDPVPAGPRAPARPAAEPPRVFAAGPFPGEPRRTRIRAALWLAAVLAVLAAVSSAGLFR